MLNRFGTAATLTKRTRVAGATSTKKTGTETSQSIKVSPPEESQTLSADGRTTRIKTTIVNDKLDFDPENGMFLTIALSERRISDISPLRLGDDIIAWDMMLEG